MKLLYWTYTLNVGDQLNLWLWPKLLPGLLDDDETLVGAKIEIAHERPAVRGSLLTLQGRARTSGSSETTFEVIVSDGLERIATLRVVMNAIRLPRFSAGLERKSALLAAVDALQ